MNKYYNVSRAMKKKLMNEQDLLYVPMQLIWLKYFLNDTRIVAGWTK